MKGGKLVSTEYGTGKIKNSDKPVNGKIIVYLDMPSPKLARGQNVLIDPEKIEVIGFWS